MTNGSWGHLVMLGEKIWATKDSAWGGPYLWEASGKCCLLSLRNSDSSGSASPASLQESLRHMGRSVPLQLCPMLPGASVVDITVSREQSLCLWANLPWSACEWQCPVSTMMSSESPAQAVLFNDVTTEVPWLWIIVISLMLAFCVNC